MPLENSGAELPFGHFNSSKDGPTVDAEEGYFFRKNCREFTFRNITYFLLICPRSEPISEVLIFLCLEHGPTELHTWLSGELIFRKAGNKIT